MKDNSSTGRDLPQDGRRRLGSLSWRWWTLILDRVFGFGIGILLARWSGVEMYGEYVLAASIIATLVNVSDFGLTPSLLIDPDDAPSRVAPIARLKVALGIVFLLLGLLLSVLNSGRPALILIGLVFTSEAILNVARIYQTTMMAEGKYRLAFIVTAASRFVQGMFLLGVVMVGPSAHAVLFSMAIFSVGVLLLSAREYVRSGSPARAMSVRSLALSHGKLALNQVVVHLSDRFDVILLGYVLAPATVGFYGAAYVFFRNSRIVSAALSSVYLPEFGRWSRELKRERFNRSVLESLGIALAIGVPLALVLGIWGSGVIQLVFGEAFADAGIVLQILAVGIPLMFAGTLLANVLNGSGDSRTPLWAAAIAAGGNIAGNLLFTPHYGMIAAAILTISAEFVNVMMLLPAAMRMIRNAPHAAAA